MQAVPLIGLTAGVEPEAGAPWNDGAAAVRLPYLRQVERAGGIAVLLPPAALNADGLDLLLDRLDAVVFTGGPDIDPVHYGAARHPQTQVGPAERDVFELALARRAIERKAPLLAICRGMQTLNVALGGSLHQHLPDVVGSTRHHSRVETAGEYDVRLAAGSLAAVAAGRLLVRATESKHHQGIDGVGEGLQVSGWAVVDGLPVAVEMPGPHFVLGVQWHPEVSEDGGFIAALVRAARATPS